MSLEEKNQKLLLLIQTLKDAYNLGYEVQETSSFSSSPIDVLLSVFVDLCLILKDLYREGSPGRRKNPELRFLQISDALGNRKSVKIRPDPEFFWDPQAPQFFMELAEFFVRMKARSSLHDSFMESFQKFSTLSPPMGDKRTQNIQKDRSASKDKQNIVFYHRRQIRKKRIKRTNQ